MHRLVLIIPGTKMDTISTEEVVYTTGVVTDPSQDFPKSSRGAEVDMTAETTTTSLGGLQIDTQRSSNAGFAAGVTVLVIVLIAAGVGGFIFYLKRRKSKRTNAVVDSAKNGTERRVESKTTWHDIELNSARSSDVSTVVDYDVEEGGIEMQPSSRFPVSSMFMCDDDDSTDVEFQSHIPAIGGTVGSPQVEASETYETPTLIRNTDSQSKGLEESEAKTTVGSDKITKSFQVEECVAEVTDSARLQNNSNVENDLVKKFEVKYSYSEDTKTSILAQRGSELARNSEVKNDSTIKIKLALSDNLNENETINLADGISWTEAQPENDELYVNHAIIRRNNTSESNITTEEISEIIHEADNVSRTSGKSAEVNDTQTQTKERNTAKAPIPQPRLTKTEASNTVGMLTNDTSHSDFTSEKDNQEVGSGTREENHVEYNQDTYDSVESDYDTVDYIYDCPMNNKEIGESDEFRASTMN